MKMTRKILWFIVYCVIALIALLIVLIPSPAKHHTDVCELTQHYVWGEYKYHTDIVSVHVDECIPLCEHLAAMLELTTKMDGAYFTCRLVSEIPQEALKKMKKENEL